MRYEAPQTLDQAVNVFSEFNGLKRILAGGTDILVQLRTDVIQPELLMNIKDIKELGKIELFDNFWKIGAGVSAANITGNKEFSKEWPGITEGVGLIGSTQIQNRATLVGNLSNASPAADGVPALVAANAMVEIIGRSGNRKSEILPLISGPGKLNIKSDEFISHVLIPRQNKNSSDCYMRFIPRTEMDIAVVGCGVNLSVENNNISAVRVVLGAVGPKVIFSEEASNSLLGASLNADSLSKLQEICERDAKPIDDKRGTIDFRRKVAGVLAKRAVEKAYKRIMEDS